MELTILMPCLNEEMTIVACVRQARAYLSAENIEGEILVADNGSSDRSVFLAKQEGARVIHVSTRGYGATLREGIAAANGTYIIMGDADCSYDFSRLNPFLTLLQSGYDLVVGNRFKGGIMKGAMPFLNRYLGNPILTSLGRLLFKCPLGDFHCGLRGFNRSVFMKVGLETSGMEFASEMIVKATLSDLRMIEVPIILAPDGRNRNSHLRRWKDGWRHLKFMILAWI